MCLISSPLLEQRVIDVQHGAARIAEDELDALVDQRLNVISAPLRPGL
jgi:hypothetical protein